MDHVVSVAMGLGLAAACGFRVFVPLLVMSIASYSGYLELGSGFEWIGSLPALVTFGTATVLEIAAYYIPWVDNALDTISGPAAVVAGTIVAASTIGDVDPFLKWSLAIIGGGGLAGIVKGSTTMVRGASTVTTAGFANFIVSTLELGGSFLMAVLAVVVPLVALALVVVLAVVSLRKLRSLFGQPQSA